MKLILAIIHESDQGRTRQALLKAGFKFTRLASTGGFLLDGNTTFVIGCAEDEVDRAISIVKDNCKTREQYINAPLPDMAVFASAASTPVKILVGGAVLFVIDVERFESV
jgi:uncharacterized protein YaaQ